MHTTVRAIARNNPPKLQPVCRIQRTHVRKLAPRILFIDTNDTTTNSNNNDSSLSLFQQQLRRDLEKGVAIPVGVCSNCAQQQHQRNTLCSTTQLHYPTTSSRVVLQKQEE